MQYRLFSDLIFSFNIITHHCYLLNSFKILKNINFSGLLLVDIRIEKHFFRRDT